LLVLLSIGAAVSVSLGVYGRVHDPTGDALVSSFFTSSINLKVWFATTAFILAILQGLSAAKFCGKLGKGYGPRWLGRAHRVSGTLAFMFAIPVAYHCLWSLGFQSGQTRVLVHGLFGCLFFGALTAKVLVVRTPKMPRLAAAGARRRRVHGAHRALAHERVLVLHHGGLPGDLTMKRTTFNLIVELVLLAGAIVFVALLAGVDLGLTLP
jgi:hypothetical protein